MPPLIHILAASSDDGLIRLAMLAFFVLVAIIVGIVQAIKKSSRNTGHAQGQMSWQDILRQMGGQGETTWTGDRMQQRPPPIMPPPVPVQAPPLPPPIRQGPAHQKPKKRKARQEPQPQVMELPPESITLPLTESRVAPVAGARGAAPHPLHEMLAGKSLRQQFVLMEVLKPPLALRGPDERL